jgi:lipid A ethanolaminephosphotransferase
MIENFRGGVKKILTQYKLITLAALFVVVFGNYAFFKNSLKVYEFSAANALFIISLFILLFCVTVFIFALCASKYTTKPLLIITLLTSSFASYFMNSYNVVMDDEMIRNTIQTDIYESSDLFTLKLALYVLLLGVLPAIYVYKVQVNYGSFKQEIFRKIRTLLFALIAIIIIIFSFSKFYASFVREHKPLRYYTNPTYWIYSVGKYISDADNRDVALLKEIGQDAQIILENGEHDKKELIILVVGEAARADRFSLNGYKRETNPNLKKEDIINFPNMHSCGTSTAESVPCMFSIFDREDYSYNKAASTQNILDVLAHTGRIKILWRDNNSDSKGVAIRMQYENYKTPANNTLCADAECRDEGMLIGLDTYIKKHEGKDVLIVLHQMGNHGPAYYKRYPKEFEKFTPVCKTNQLEKCSMEEIGNAYDNALLYTDYFLAKVINFLKPYDKTHEAAMVYMSDHGESLGENGLYLHGLPYFMAPETQTHIGSLIWLGDSIKEDIDVKKLKSYSDQRFSQDNLFHSLLGLFEVDTEVYKQEHDIFKNASKH